jgi:hypothetical protein
MMRGRGTRAALDLSQHAGELVGDVAPQQRNPDESRQWLCRLDQAVPAQFDAAVGLRAQVIGAVQAPQVALHQMHLDAVVGVFVRPQGDPDRIGDDEKARPAPLLDDRLQAMLRYQAAFRDAGNVPGQVIVIGQGLPHQLQRGLYHRARRHFDRGVARHRRDAHFGGGPGGGRQQRQQQCRPQAAGQAAGKVPGQAAH